jgi:large subunit ribosomal protein L5
MAAKSTKKDKQAEAASAVELPAMPRMQEKYVNEVLPALKEKLGRTNPHALPKLTKIVVSMGVGSAVTEKKHMEEALAALQTITGQKPAPCKSRHSISNFKLREGLEIGAKVTLRGPRMWEFLDRLVSLALPRVRDFRGLNPKAFDGQGNYSLGLTEQLVFPEINPDKFTRTQGMNIAFITTTDSNDEARELLKGLGMPFRVDEPAAKKETAATA